MGDQLDAVGYLKNAQCDIPCPGDPGLFCGGRIFSLEALRELDRRGMGFNRRALSPNILLTLYELVADATTTLTDTTAVSTAIETSEIVSSTATSTSDEPPSALPDFTTTVPVSTVSSDGVPVSTLYDTTTVDLPGVDTITITTTVQAATTTSTVTFTTLDLRGSALIVTDVVFTMEYYPCSCLNNGIPYIEMTTTQVPCRACELFGNGEEDDVTLTVPRVGFCTPTAGSGGDPTLEPWLQYASDSYPDGSRPSLPEKTVYNVQTAKAMPTNPGIVDAATGKESLYSDVSIPAAVVPSAAGADSPVVTEGGEVTSSGTIASGSSSFIKDFGLLALIGLVYVIV